MVLGSGGAPGGTNPCCRETCIQLAQMIDFYYGEASEKRLAAAVAEAKAEQEGICNDRLREKEDDLAAAILAAERVQDLELLEAAATKLHWSDDRKSKRHNYIIAHIKKRIAIGKKKIVVLDLQNSSEKPFEVGAVELIDAKTKMRMKNVIHWPEEIRLPAKSERTRMSVRLEAAIDDAQYIIRIKENGPRSIEIVDISL